MNKAGNMANGTATATTANSTPVIRLRNVVRKFQLGDQTVHALDNISLTINQGEYVSIMGPSGSGKSTLLNALGLLDKPDSGSYLLDNVETVSMAEEQRAKLRRDKIGFVFQSFHLIPRLTAQENIELPMLLEGVAPAERQRRSAEVMERLNLKERARHKPGQLSGGQQQRVAIARAIVMRPSLLLTDEPTGNLDSRSGSEVLELLEELNRSGITLLMVTHDTVLGNRAHRHIRMVDGKIVDNGENNLAHT
jgi:putative ABC transport system ATP-binding protein